MLIKESYTFITEKNGYEMKDAAEFATLLNATGRYEKANIGLKICIDDNKKYYIIAKKLLAEHRKNLVNGLNYVKKIGLTQLKNIQYFYSKDNIKETIVGIIASMFIGIKTYDLNKPIIGFALSNSNDEIKVSARATNELIKNGVNLSKAMEKVSYIVGGKGGGHDIAAGATIPREKLNEFINELDNTIENQIQIKKESYYNLKF